MLMDGVSLKRSMIAIIMAGNDCGCVVALVVIVLVHINNNHVDAEFYMMMRKE